MFRNRTVIIVGLILIVGTLLLGHREAFTDFSALQSIGNPEGIPDPTQIMKGLRQLLDRYEKPEMWATVMANAQRTPGELARSVAENNT